MGPDGVPAERRFRSEAVVPEGPQEGAGKAPPKFPPALSVNGLRVSYGRKTVLSDVTFEIQQGSLVGIIGPNGAGKSTMLKAILGLIAKDGGTVSLLGERVRKMRRRVAYVPQRMDIDWTFPISVFEAVLLGTYPGLRLFQRPGPAERDRAARCLERVGMAPYAGRQIGALSVGQQQRMFIARALAQDAPIFFLDEPFAGVDMASEQVIIDILRQEQDRGKTILVVHHDLSTVRKYFSHVIMLNRTVRGFGAVGDVFTPEALIKTFAIEGGFKAGTGSGWLEAAALAPLDAEAGG